MTRARRPRRRLTVLLVTLSMAMGAGVVHGMATPTPAALQIHKVDPARFDPAPDEPVFVLVLGHDARPGETVSRSDAMHLIALNPAMGRATMLDIPRDTYVPIPGYGSDKINNAFALGGPRLAAQAVGDLVGVSIPFVIATGFTGFSRMIDELGGVTVDIPVKMADSNSDAYFEKGPRHLTGDEALAFSRDRQSTGGGDFDRTHRQGQLILAGLAKLRGENPSPVNTIKWLAVLLRHTSIEGVSIPELYRLGRMALAVDPTHVANVVMPGESGVAGDASVIYATAAAAPLFADFRDDGIVSQAR